MQNKTIGNEFEIINYNAIKHLKVFVNKIIYRNYHFHSSFELLYVINGEANLVINGKTLSVSIGDIAIINPYTAHEIVSKNSECTFVIAQISSSFCNDYFSFLKNLRFSTIKITKCDDPILQHKLQTSLIELATTLLERQNCFELACVSKLCDLLFTLITNVDNVISTDSEALLINKKMQRMKNLQRYVEDNQFNKVTLEDLAAKENVTRTYISHFFKDNFGISFQDYSNNLHFETALRLIQNSSNTLIDISNESGFSDIKYMNQMFQKHFSMSPKAYRATIKTLNTDEITPLDKNSIERILSTQDSLTILKSISL